MKSGHLDTFALSGQVEWQFQRAVAENDIRRLSGVAGVVNASTIKAKVQPTDVKHGSKQL